MVALLKLSILWENFLKQFYHYVLCPLSDIVVARMQDVVDIKNLVLPGY